MTSNLETVNQKVESYKTEAAAKAALQQEAYNKGVFEARKKILENGLAIGLIPAWMAEFAGVCVSLDEPNSDLYKKDFLPFYVDGYGPVALIDGAWAAARAVEWESGWSLEMEDRYFAGGGGVLDALVEAERQLKRRETFAAERREDEAHPALKDIRKKIESCLVAALDAEDASEVQASATLALALMRYEEGRQ